MDEEDHNQNRDVSALTLLLIPAFTVAAINLAFYNRIKSHLVPEPGHQNDGNKKTRFTIFFAINIFAYLSVTQIFFGGLYLPIFLCLTISAAGGYLIAKYMFPEHETILPEVPIEEDKDFTHLLGLLGLDEASKLTLQDQRMVKDDLNTNDCRDIIQTFLNRLSFGQQTAVQDLSDHLKNLEEVKEKSNGDDGIRDILFAILTCCDIHLLQEVLRNLSLIGKAVPIILPRLHQNPVLLHYGLRRSYVCTSTEDVTGIINQPFVTISCFRFGKVSVSKTMVLNEMLSAMSNSDTPCKTYLSEDKDNALSKGIVECAWYLPTQEENDIKVPLAILNLQGDSLNHKVQAQFCCKVSSTVILFVETTINDEVQKRVKEISESSNVILVSNYTDSMVPFQKTQNVTFVEHTAAIRPQLGHILLNHITKTVLTDKQISFAMFPQICEILDIDVDDEFLNFKSAKVISHNIVDAVEAKGKAQRDIFPLQDLWKDWVEVDREDIGVDGIEHKISNKLHRKREIRNLQKDSSLGEPLKIFLSCLDSDIENSHLLYRYLETFSVLRLGTVLQNEQDTNIKFDVNDLVHEVGQMMECDHPRIARSANSATDNETYPEKFAYLFERGVSLPLCHSNANAIGIKWLHEVFDSLQCRFISDFKVCVVSIIGCKETKKTSLINQLFGVNFSFCTKGDGLIVQLLPVRNANNANIPYDFLLILNTESFNIEKTSFQADIERNNFICSLATCLADVVLINTTDEMCKEDKKTFMKTISKSLLRMKEVNKSGKCFLVNHTQTNPSNSDWEYDSDKVFKETINYLQEILQSDGNEISKQDISDIFLFQNERCAFTVRPSETFLSSKDQHQSSDVLALRQFILKLLESCTRPHMSFNGFCQRLADVDKALKTSSFVENFQDTNIEKLKDEFVALYRGMILQIRQDLSEKLALACNDLRYGSSNDMENLKSKQLDVLSQTASDKMKAFQQNVSEMLQSPKYKCLQAQEHYFAQDIESNKVSFLQTVEQCLQEITEEVKRSESIVKQVKNARELFIEKLEENTKDSTETFERTKQEFLNTMQRRYPLYELRDIQQNTEENMLYILKQCGKEVESLLTNRSLSECANAQKTSSTSNIIRTINDNFNVANEDISIIFDKVHSKITNISSNPHEIAATSKELCVFLKEFENEFSVVVDRITMYLYFGSNFLSKVHEAHLRNDIKALSVDDIESTDRRINEKITSLFNHVDYEIKLAEPLDYTSLESKAVLFLSNLEKVCSNSDMIVLREVMTSSNITKCTLLPFNLITLQRLDRYFLSMLPILSSEDMNSINSTVIEAKMTVIGRALSKAFLDFSRTLHEMFNLIHRAIIDGSDSEKAKAAALVHISAWSSHVISLKKLEQHRVQNIVNTFSHEESTLCLAIQKTRNFENCDSLVGEIVGKALVNSVVKVAEESLVRRIRDSLFVKSEVFNLKRTFIGTVLRDLCVKGDYLGFAQFFKNYDSFTEKWILEFIANECNKSDNSNIETLKIDIMRFFITKTNKVIEETMKQFASEASQSLKMWLELFQKNMRTYCKTCCSVSTLDEMANLATVHNFENFTESMRIVLKQLKSLLEESIILPKRGNMDDTKTWLMSLPGQIHIELAQIIKGCTEQCPFCGAVCENTLEGHEFHGTELHYPGGLKGWHEVESMTLFIEVCTSAVASQMKYRSPKSDFRSYSEYKEDYPTWNIPSKVDEPNEFWKYIFTRLNRQFAKHYNCVEADIPEDWSKFTKEEAIRSVERAYDLIPLNLTTTLDRGM
ncbi:interferon-induced very large GTPase 1-like [Apostichopus japonicus]|uniref:interferon-induced very large GTPase 1-like n=1 Tax=Stichopus japonicus TaxID=307972 RepID=UPI003AB3E1C2